MRYRRDVGLMSAGAVLALLTVAASADTLVMRDGKRVEGRLVAVRDGMIEFEGQRGFFAGRERFRVDREDVRRIELDDDFDSDRNGSSAAGPSSSRPLGLRERDVTVDSWEPLKDSGIDVRAGQTIYFSATGRVRWGPGRQDGPEGERGSPRNDQRPIPSRPAAALIGRVGDSDDYFFVGDDKGPIRIRQSGRLYLGVNDDFLQDNTGSFRVTVYY